MQWKHCHSIIREELNIAPHSNRGVEVAVRYPTGSTKVGTLIGPEYSLILVAADLTPTNTLENLMANRIADMDKGGTSGLCRSLFVRLS
jgi:hypothetical protein